MSENNFESIISSLMKGMNTVMTSKTVVGDAIKVDEHTTILPLVDVSFGAGAGAYLSGEKKTNSGGGGMSGKITPSSVIVIKDGNVRLVNIRNQDTMTKILDMVPDMVDKFTDMIKNKNGAKITEDDVNRELDKAKEDKEKSE